MDTARSVQIAIALAGDLATGAAPFAAVILLLATQRKLENIATTLASAQRRSDVRVSA